MNSIFKNPSATGAGLTLIITIFSFGMVYQAKNSQLEEAHRRAEDNLKRIEALELEIAFCKRDQMEMEVVKAQLDGIQDKINRITARIN